MKIFIPRYTQAQINSGTGRDLDVKCLFLLLVGLLEIILIGRALDRRDEIINRVLLSQLQVWPLIYYQKSLSGYPIPITNLYSVEIMGFDQLLN